MEDHSLGGNSGIKYFKEVPRNGLSLPVFVGGEIELVDFLQPLLKLCDDILLVGVDHVEGLEAIVHVDARPRPWL